MENQPNNSAAFCGELVQELTYSHDIFAERFYTCSIKVRRLSGQYDVLPVTVSERLLEGSYALNERLAVNGQIRSYNIVNDGKSHLVLQIFAHELYKADELPDDNCVTLNGFLCKAPVYRVTPFQREIADILLAVNRSYGKSDYIPCICWGRNARWCRNLEVSQQLCITGRLQSRLYNKQLADGTTEQRIAYEVSVQKAASQSDCKMA